MPWTTPGTATAGDVLTASFWNLQVRDNMNTLVAAGTVLPSSPGDGESFYYIADSTNGVVWHLRYRSAATGSYKWEFVGGGCLSSRDTTSRTTASSTYQTTGSPSVTLPLAGDYEITFGANTIQSNVAGSNFMVLALHVNAVMKQESAAQGVGSGNAMPSSYTTIVAGASASQAADVRYKSASSLSSTFLEMFLTVRPRRVG